MNNIVNMEQFQLPKDRLRSGKKVLSTHYRNRRKASLFAVLCFFTIYVSLFAAIAFLSNADTSKKAKFVIQSASHRIKRSSRSESPSDANTTTDGNTKDGQIGAPLNCTPRAVNEFPGDFFTEEQEKNGGLVVHFIIALYLFAALAIACDDYFVPSLELISDKLGLQSDVAGATFMAAGSSAPELFTSVIGVFISKNDVGVSTIVGSAIFNILAIVALVGLGAGMVIHLTWWPLFRDTAYYTLSVIGLIIVINDGKVYWYEGLIFIIMYIIYIVIMYFNRRLESYFTSKVRNWGETCCKKGEKGDETTPLMFGNKDFSESFKSNSEAESTFGAPTEESVDLDDEYESPLTFPKSWPKRIFWIVMLPMNFLFMLIIPDCRRPGCWRRLFALTFIMSIAMIAVCTYVLVWMVTIIGDRLGIPDTVMGLTLLAAGTSVPDALAGLLVARDGLGDMAISNAVGSNVFDILLCLGLPWLLKTTAVEYGPPVGINSSGLVYSAVTLMSTVVILFLVMLIAKWKLNKKIGALFLVIYVVVTALACLYELNIFGDFNPPPCPR